MELGAKASTRAEEGEPPTRFYAQAVTAAGALSAVAEGEANADGKYEFTLRLAPKTSYTYMFWADNATENDKPDDLRSVSYHIGSIAFVATTNGMPEEIKTDITLQHVVTKVTLKTTTDVENDDNPINLTASCASSYNVQTLSPSTFTDQSASMTMPADGLAAGREVLVTYIIPDTNKQSVTIGAHGQTMVINDVPLETNTHVTLQGDLSENNPNWISLTE